MRAGFYQFNWLLRKYAEYAEYAEYAGADGLVGSADGLVGSAKELFNTSATLADVFPTKVFNCFPNTKKANPTITAAAIIMICAIDSSI